MPRKLPVESRCRRRISVQNFKPPEIRQSSLNHRPLKPGLEHHLENRNSVLDRKPQNICLKRAAAAAAALLRRGRARPADTCPGESPPIRRIYANCDYPVAAHDQGNVTAAQETRYR